MPHDFLPNTGHAIPSVSSTKVEGSGTMKLKWASVMRKPWAQVVRIPGLYIHPAGGVALLIYLHAIGGRRVVQAAVDCAQELQRRGVDARMRQWLVGTGGNLRIVIVALARVGIALIAVYGDVEAGF
jgi:hypothetical protein